LYSWAQREAGEMFKEHPDISAGAGSKSH